MRKTHHKKKNTVMESKRNEKDELRQTAWLSLNSFFNLPVAEMRIRFLSCSTGLE